MTASLLKHRAFIGLGSNLDQPSTRVIEAIKALDQLPLCRVAQQSPLYLSTPVGPQDQDDFVNAVVELHTAYTPLALLDQLQRLEQTQRRVRLRHWGPRTLDLDLLLYDTLALLSPRLEVPHREMLNRVFVWAPLLDIAPEATLPDGQAIKTRVPLHDRAQLKRIPLQDND
ncbi:2-amino-4-hydroxy-6-hydroxymethyldihydropteridine diphosphokinase [Carnimonas nigrificans]|uniref:2-amino-4-hydroxy-6- hydroxymethyldihydropteridine diphosphokinase n=1 Tax=Carnimonas nigrificans TaxID=64323 RepID=UPI000471D4EF|nr:2-amino-4-hydroxy-6-hydroxymethyldihydropteridine diphosphokinase [Carnimonas nigrificans]